MAEETRHDDRKNEHDHHESGGADGSDGDHGHRNHDHHAHDAEEITAGVVTVSSSRESGEDPSGDAIIEVLEDNGIELTHRELIPDDFDRAQQTVDTLTDRDDVDLIVTTGGTGVTPDDVTVEAVEPLLGKMLPGFGELFRTLSYEEVGTHVVATRAIAGIADGVPVFCLPGSENAVRLGTRDIIVEEAGHLIGLATRDDEDE
ncbi:MogA/MoaB family molybdenum cofactor biosynthesis protein [Halalkalicoccus jeotgali]|uniref:Molybdenum cofactor biosynthesis protein B n=1 Tax=Halalkalicoccus jeotgali (strain DSM 18796 / CECT 7217 / JCM 14584 / KCTC 4019 / B3) TaxID=795797 RepID=D8JAD2_HALJB|nr:MogA/MoaB family molybdenum cofactor biosynthesis protein [Halalkalicoccus jeotgali]ADJ14654.1 molybdenum cofactor biosynthesis protein B [Halalkalicoccus jeotgali B3]ELY39552.1 molybdenum cofactor biosynthesis protein B [Halalkalicoccus jeotgali B3]